MNRKYICCLLLFIIFCYSVVAGAEPNIGAAAAVLMEKENGQILLKKNIHSRLPPASLTKILTAVVALEEGNLEDTVAVSARAAGQEGSSIWLVEGEKLKLEDLLYGLLLASGNDAAVAIAEHIAGSVEEFARIMTEKAEKMGAKNSNFLNPHGLPQSGHYSTAFDIAMIMRYALDNPQFVRIIGTKTKTIPWANNEWDRGLRNHNKLLWSYEGITGGKTGYTRAAGRCLLVSAAREERELIAVVLNSPSDWIECTSLLDYGFNNFMKKRIIEKGDSVKEIEWQDSREKTLQLVAGKSISLIIPAGGEIEVKKIIKIDSRLTLPLRKGQEVGNLQIFKEQYLIGETPLLAAHNINYKSLWHYLYQKITAMIKRE